MFGMRQDTVRGNHANKKTNMCFLAISGKCKITVDNGIEKETFLMDNPAHGLVCEAMTWKKMFDFSPDCVLMVICDTNYDENEYIDDYNTFKKKLKND
jgi:hypothetical protein